MLYLALVNPPSITLLCQDKEVPTIEASTLKSVPGPSKGSALAGRSFSKDVSRRIARSGMVLPCVSLPTDPVNIADGVDVVGWKAYRMDVPAGTKVNFEVKTQHPSWFQLVVTNKWGDLEQGMFQNTIYKGKPVASYINSGKTVRTIYVVVDSMEDSIYQEKYTLEVRF